MIWYIMNVPQRSQKHVHAFMKNETIIQMRLSDSGLYVSLCESKHELCSVYVVKVSLCTDYVRILFVPPDYAQFMFAEFSWNLGYE